METRCYREVFCIEEKKRKDMKETIFLNYLFLSFLGDLSFHLETEMLNFYVFTEQQKILKNCFSRVIILKILFSFTKSS